MPIVPHNPFKGRQYAGSWALVSPVPESSVSNSSNAGGLTRSTTDQRPQKVAVALVVACRLLLVQRQSHPHSLEIFWLTRAGTVSIKIHSSAGVETCPCAEWQKGCVAESRMRAGRDRLRPIYSLPV
jgi:hypothetical protein